MSLTTVAENTARFMAVFGLFVVVGMLGVGIYQATLVDDVYDQLEPNQLQDNGQPKPAAFQSTEVRDDWQTAMTIQGWSRPVLLLGLGSILVGIILNFAVVIYTDVKAMSYGLPELWQGYLAAQTGEPIPVENRVDDDVELPFGGGA